MDYSHYKDGKMKLEQAKREADKLRMESNQHYAVALLVTVDGTHRVIVNEATITHSAFRYFNGVVEYRTRN